MGYTHYWTQSANFTEDEWDYVRAFFTKMRELLPQHRTTAWDNDEVPELFGWDGIGSPEMSAVAVGFNGDKSKEINHETFRVEKRLNEDSWQFCKTARKPYDVAVNAMLLMFSTMTPTTFTLATDGTNTIHGEEWDGGRKLFCATYRALYDEGIYLP